MCPYFSIHTIVKVADGKRSGHTAQIAFHLLLSRKYLRKQEKCVIDSEDEMCRDMRI